MTDTNLSGMARTSGKPLSGLDHIAQSIGDILSTPLGTRVMRRDYGSLLFELTDAPLNRATALLLIAATAMAIARWEPRYTVTRVQLSGDVASGQATVTLTGSLTNQPAPNALTTLTIPITPPNS
jgi:phage baseplate assembly protein W